MKTFSSYKELIEEIKHERDKCKRESYSRDFQLIRSRGTSLLQMGENGRVYDEAWFTRSSNPTLRELKEAAKSTLENGGFYVSIDGGFDGVYSIRDNDCEPLIGEWCVDISVENILAL
jgi:predicted ATPase